ncbi:unnamed protein product [Durusdinium trenchii]|uniref:Transmembrane protein n=2 Tax=Durusdinium trenchii TaxID=1381693 RepID=A0ABP0KVQ4_9DINO
MECCSVDRQCCSIDTAPEHMALERPEDPMEDEEIGAISGMACARAMADATFRREAEKRERERKEEEAEETKSLEFPLERKRPRPSQLWGVLPASDGIILSDPEQESLRRSKSIQAIRASQEAHREFLHSYCRIEKDLLKEVKATSIRGSLRARPWLSSSRASRSPPWSLKDVQVFDVFLSHVWKSHWKLKSASLLLQSGWFFMVMVWATTTALVFVLCLLDFLPLDWSYEAEALGDLVECHLGFWILALSMIASLLALLVSPYLPELWISEACFLDAASINQRDEHVKRRCIQNLAGFLRISTQLRILWTPEFTSRLWCIFEVAAFKRINPTAQIIISPLSIEVFLLFLMPLVSFSCLIYLIGLAAQQRVLFGALVSLIATIPCVYSIHRLRRDLHSKKDTISKLDTFDLREVQCSSASDQELLLSTISEWYGTHDEFTLFVRHTLRDELLELSGNEVPAFYYFFPCMPVVSVALDFLVGFIKAGIRAPWQVSYVIAVPLGFGLWVSMATALLLHSCHFFSTPARLHGLDAMKSALLFLSWVTFQVFGLLCSILCHMSSIWAVLAWSCFSLLSFRSFLWCAHVG